MSPEFSKPNEIFILLLIRLAEKFKLTNLLSDYPAPAPFSEKIVSYNKNEHMTNFRKKSKYSFLFHFNYY